MVTISRSALLPYSAADMFALVNDIEAYPQYLKGCLGAKVLSATPEEITATLDLGKLGLRYSLTTRNQLHEPDTIDMTLVDGPFQEFSARWSFDALRENACKTSLQMHFSMKSTLVDSALGALFESTAKDLVNAVCERAEKIYGKR